MASCIRALKEFFTGRCRYADMCHLYQEASVCDKDAGSYYGFNRKAGCYRDFEASEARLNHIKMGKERGFKGKT